MGLYGIALVDPIHYAAKTAENTTPRRKYNILGQNTFPRAPKSGQHLKYFVADFIEIQQAIQCYVRAIYCLLCS